MALWLPKWLRDDEPPAEGVTRRTFLFLGASAGVGLLLPSPDLSGFGGELLLAEQPAYSVLIPVHLGRNVSPLWMAEDGGFPTAGQQAYETVSVPMTEAQYLNYRIDGQPLPQSLLDAAFERARKQRDDRQGLPGYFLEHPQGDRPPTLVVSTPKSVRLSWRPGESPFDRKGDT